MRVLAYTSGAALNNSRPAESCEKISDRIHFYPTRQIGIWHSPIPDQPRHSTLHVKQNTPFGFATAAKKKDSRGFSTIILFP